MRAKLVNENISFTRGQDPKKSMDIGSVAANRKLINDTVWSLQLPSFLYEIVGHDWDFMGHPILVAKVKDPIHFPERSHVAVTDIPGISIQHSPNELQAYSDIKDKIKAYVQKNESYNFERGKDPRKAMDVGVFADADWDYDIGDAEIVSEYIYKGYPVRIFKKYWHENSPYPEYCSISAGGITKLFYPHRIKWYKGKAWAKRWMNEIIDTLEKYRALGKKPKGLKESVNFERGMDPKDSMGIGVNANVMEFLNWVRNDFQLDKSHDEYFGYINLGADNDGLTVFPKHPKLQMGYERFQKDWKKYLPIMKDMGLYIIDPPHYEETIIYDDSILKPKTRGLVLESYNFERGKDPKEAMSIGHQAYLKREASKIDWDWYPDPEDEEEIIWLKKIHGLNVKVARLSDTSQYNPDDEEYRDDVYYAVSDSGEPYMDAPTFYSTPREALDWEEEYIGQLEEPDASDHEIII